MRHARIAVVLVVAATVAFGADTKLTTTYRDPQVGKVAFKKIVVAYISTDADLRRRVEDGLARRVRNSVAARTLVPEAETRDRDAVKARLASNGVDGAIVVKLVSHDRDVDVAAGQVAVVADTSMWDTWGTSWAVVEMPGHATMTQTVTAEIAVYDVGTTKLIWAGRMKAVDPKSLRVLLDNLVKEAAAELRKQRII